jgi:hypothetical protein
MKCVLVGITHPFRDSMFHYTSRPYQSLHRRYEVKFCSFERQYPPSPFPGKADGDPSRFLPDVAAAPLSDPINPLSWLRA